VRPSHGAHGNGSLACLRAFRRPDGS
jgi:hypothetical protein